MAPPRQTFATITCQHCGKEFEARRFVVGRGKYRSPDKMYSAGFRKQRYCSGTCRNLARGASKGFVHHTGYRIVSAGARGSSIAEHRLVMQRFLGRKLEKHETVHHKNGDRLDNRLENLELWTSRHGRGQRASDLEPDIWSGMIPSYLVNCRL